MRKISIAILLFISLLFLAGCKQEKKDTGSSSSTTTSSSSSSSSSQSTKTSSNQTVKTSDAQSSDLTKARLALYQAGVDSSSLEDDEVSKLWSDSRGNKANFVKLVKEKLGK